MPATLTPRSQWTARQCTLAAGYHELRRLTGEAIDALGPRYPHAELWSDPSEPAAHIRAMLANEYNVRLACLANGFDPSEY